jgi:hypothetical protein
MPEMHVSYMFCPAWQNWQPAPISPVSAAAIGGGPDPLEWMQEAGMKLGVGAPRQRPAAPRQPATTADARQIDFLGR